MKRANSSSLRGFSMIETVLCTLLVGMVVVGSLSALRNAVRTQMEMNSLIDGPMLAEQLLAEAVALAYKDPEGGNGRGVNSGENPDDRTTFDDVDDFDSWNAGQVQARDGTPLAAYAGWTRTVQVVWATRLGGDAWYLYDTGLKRVRVRVTAPDGTVTTRYGYRSRDGALEQPPTIDCNVVHELNGTLQMGSGEAAEWCTNLLNHAEDPNA